MQIAWVAQQIQFGSKAQYSPDREFRMAISLLRKSILTGRHHADGMGSENGSVD
jgi:hypothetical protein